MQNLYLSLKFNRQQIALALIILVGVMLRAHGLFWDQPYFFNPDEKRLVEWGRDFNTLDPLTSEWGTLPQLTVKTLDTVLSFFFEPRWVDLYPYTRSLSVLISAATIVLVYLLAKRAFNRHAAFWAAAFTAFTVLFIQDAHFYSLDGMFTFFMLLALFPILDIAKSGQAKSYVMAGLLIGLTMAVRVNGLFLLLPLFVAHFYTVFDQTQSRRRIVTKMITHKGLWLSILLFIITFVILTPNAVLNPRKYLFYDALVWVMLQTSGYIKSRYTLQFEGTTPIYYVSNLLFWAAGPFLLLAYLTGLVYAIFKWRHRANIILLSLLLLFVWTGAGARVKFIRYVLPVLPLLNIMAASFFVRVLAMFKHRPLLRWGVTVWLGLTLIGSALYALAFANIYSRPDTRILAGDWLIENLPGDAIIARGSNDYRSGLFEGPNRPHQYNLRKLDFDRLYRSSPVALSSHFPPIFKQWGIEVSRRGDDSNFDDNSDFTPLSPEEMQFILGEQLYCADYVVFTERNYALYKDRANLFPVEHNYYSRLFAGELGFQQIKIFERKPGLFDWQIDDSAAELTFRLFDHPSVWVFRAQPAKEFITAHPPEHATQINWDGELRLIGYTLNPAAINPGQQTDLTLYWEALAQLDRNLLISAQLQNEAGEIIAKNDHQVADGLLPTSCWKPGHVVVDKIAFKVPSTAPPGTHHLAVGLTTIDTQLVVPIINKSGSDHTAHLGDVQLIQN